jgi:hypothetical protein
MNPTPLGAPRRAAPATVKVTGSSRTGFDLRVTSTDGQPFWLVLGQSYDAAWQADAGGGARVVDKQIVNGYANGWQIAPARAGTFTVHLRWVGQRIIWVGLVATGLALLLCLALIWRARRPRAGPAAVESAAPIADDESTPRLESPLVSTGGRPTTRAVVLSVLGSGLVAGVASRPWIGLLVAAGVGAALWWPRARALLTVGSVGALGVAVLYVVVQQGRYKYPTIYNWPSNFNSVADVAWLAVMLLGADALVHLVRAHAARRGEPDAAEHRTPTP